jgi:hypothetical protein
MLDHATIERLLRTLEKNEPTANVALAEAGNTKVLLALARSHAVGPEVLAIIGQRIAEEGSEVGFDREAPQEFVPVTDDLDRLLITHPKAPGTVRDAVLGRHPGDAFFVLAAACHPQATLSAVERAVDWPAASPIHDRIWLTVIDPATVPPPALEAWAQGSLVLRREAAARIGRGEALFAVLGRDRSRQVRRAVASNPFAGVERARLAAEDPAPDVRARAGGPLSPGDDRAAKGTGSVETEAFTASLEAMSLHGVLAPDVVHALSSDAGRLDEEGALLAGLVLPQQALVGLLDQVLALGIDSTQAHSLAAGLALRSPKPSRGQEGPDKQAEIAEIGKAAVKSLTRTAAENNLLTGHARFAAWAATGMVRCEALDRDRILHHLSHLPLGSDRLILGRAVALRPTMLGELCGGVSFVDVVPPTLLELAWANPGVTDAVILELAARIAEPSRRADDLPEDEVDLDPCRRSLPTLEKVVLATTVRANTSPRAALATVALDARRVRYVLAGMPQWKGRLTGGRLSRVFRQHAGTLPVAQGEIRPRNARTEPWTERLLSEIELAVALAVGHLTGAEVARRLQLGRQTVESGLTLASGVEARAAIEGQAAIQPILEWGGRNRTSQGAALALWLLLERFDQARSSLAMASAIDGFVGVKGAMPACVSDALSALEHRQPGRLEQVRPSSPQGKAILTSAIAQAYRAAFGVRHEGQRR